MNGTSTRANNASGEDAQFRACRGCENLNWIHHRLCWYCGQANPAFTPIGADFVFSEPPEIIVKEFTARGNEHIALKALVDRLIAEGKDRIEIIREVMASKWSEAVANWCCDAVLQRARLLTDASAGRSRDEIAGDLIALGRSHQSAFALADAALWKLNPNAQRAHPGTPNEAAGEPFDWTVISVKVLLIVLPVGGASALGVYTNEPANAIVGAILGFVAWAIIAPFIERPRQSAHAFGEFMAVCAAVLVALLIGGVAIALLGRTGIAILLAGLFIAGAISSRRD